MMALFRNALVYDNGTMRKLDMHFDGTSLSAFEGDVSAFDSSVIFAITATAARWTAMSSACA